MKITSISTRYSVILPFSICTFMVMTSPPVMPRSVLVARLAELQTTYGRRLATMYCDSIESIARRRLHLAALALRAYLELTGAVAYFEERLTKLLREGVSTQEQWDELWNLLLVGIHGGRFDWMPFLQGGTSMDELVAKYAKYAKAKRRGDEPTQDVRQKSPSAFIAEVEKQISKLRPSAQGKITAVYAQR
jgi:hypothetical protein